MKIAILISLFIFLPQLSLSQINSDKIIASCCDEGRGCTGSSYCAACKNCSGCKHCAKNGGSCGVCSTANEKKIKSNPSKAQSYTSTVSAKKEYSKETILIVTSKVLNLRKGASSQFDILIKLSLGDELIYLGSDSDWIRVRTKNSSVVGFVYYKYIREKKLL